MEDSAESELKCGDPVQQVLEGKNRKWPRDHSCDILAKNMAAFCLCPKYLTEAKFKSLGLMVLAREISRHLTIGHSRYLTISHPD